LYKDRNVSPTVENYYQRTAEQQVSPNPSNSPYSPRFTLNQSTGNREALLAYKSEYTRITVALVLDRRILLAPLNFLRYLTLGIGLIGTVISVLLRFCCVDFPQQPCPALLA